MKTSHVLVLDRNQARRDALVGALKVEGHVPVVVESGADAARALAVPGLDLLVIDLAIPDLVAQDAPGRAGTRAIGRARASGSGGTTAHRAGPQVHWRQQDDVQPTCWVSPARPSSPRFGNTGSTRGPRPPE